MRDRGREREREGDRKRDSFCVPLADLICVLIIKR